MQASIKFFLVLFLSVTNFAFVNASMNSDTRDYKNTSMLDSQETKQRAILITGASSGIGKTMALNLAENGFYVYAGARKNEDIKTLSAIKNIQGIRLDVTIQADIDAAVNIIKQEGRGLYGLVNNAGVFLFDPLIEVSEQDMQFIMDVNVLGPYRVTKAFAPFIIESQGRIMTTGSVAGLFSGRLFGPYGMTKHAMEAFTDALHSEMKKFNVEVGIIEPGNFRSNIMKNMQRRIEQIAAGQKDSQYAEEIKGFANFAKEDRTMHKSPKPVADALLDFLSSENPKRRYLVTPNLNEARLSIKKSLEKVIEINHDHPYQQSRDELIEIMDSLLQDMNE